MIQPLVLRGVPKHYHWGRSRQESIICKIFPELESERPMAEYWLGGHPSGPSSVRTEGSERLLTDLLQEQPDSILGPHVQKVFGKSLPFLLKILSVDAPLSIQAHPTESLALALHAQDPLNYPDTHHKPEVSVALSDCELFCGLRVPPNRFLSVLNLHEADMIAEVEKLRARLRAASPDDPAAAAVSSLLERFPDDPAAALCAEMLHYLRLKPGDAIFIPPGAIHAHLHGELIECQAGSDNVIRVALTPKHRDVSALSRLLQETSSESVEPILIPAGLPGISDLPVREFCLEMLTSTSAIGRKQRSGPELLFSLNAEGELRFDNAKLAIIQGTSLLIPHSLEKYELELRCGQLVRVSVPQ